MPSKLCASPRGAGNYSRRAANHFTSAAFLDRPLPASPLLAEIGRDISLLFDASNESQNNAERGETAFLRVNLKSCIALAQRIERRGRPEKRCQQQ